MCHSLLRFVERVCSTVPYDNRKALSFVGVIAVVVKRCDVVWYSYYVLGVIAEALTSLPDSTYSHRVDMMRRSIRIM